MSVLVLCAACFCFGQSLNASSKVRPLISEDGGVAVRVAAYNVEWGKSTTAERVGEMFKPFNLDLIGFNEVPDGDWTARVGKVLGMKHCHVGKISSAHHKDKYKSILSRTPLLHTREVSLTTQRGWNPASVVIAETTVSGLSFAFYSLHICRSQAGDGHAKILAEKILSQEKKSRIILAGDFNSCLGDPDMNTLKGAGFRSAWRDLSIDLKANFTWNAQDPSRNSGVIDHICLNLLSKGYARDGGIIEMEKPLSDHKPIWVELIFPN